MPVLRATSCLLPLAVLLGACAASHPAQAQPLSGDARGLGLSGAVTALSNHAFALANPAAPAPLGGRRTVVFAGEAYGLPELRQGAVHHSEPVSWGALTVGATGFGFEAYRELQGYAGLAVVLPGGAGRGVSLGLVVVYTHVSIPGYGSAGAVGVTLGGLIPLADVLDIGFAAHNVNDARLAGREALPRYLSLGIGYRPDRRIRLLVDVHKDLLYPPTWRGGFEYAPVEVLVVRIGMARPPSRFSAGFGVRPGPFEMDVAAVHHAPLGWSLAGSLGVNW